MGDRVREAKNLTHHSPIYVSVTGGWGERFVCVAPSIFWYFDILKGALCGSCAERNCINARSCYSSR